MNNILEHILFLIGATIAVYLIMLAMTVAPISTVQDQHRATKQDKINAALADYRAMKGGK